MVQVSVFFKFLAICFEFTVHRGVATHYLSISTLMCHLHILTLLHELLVASSMSPCAPSGRLPSLSVQPKDEGSESTVQIVKHEYKMVGTVAVRHRSLNCPPRWPVLPALPINGPPISHECSHHERLQASHECSYHDRASTN